MSLPDYSKQEAFYSYLAKTERLMNERANALIDAQNCVVQIKSETYADLYAALSQEEKDWLDSILGE